MPQVEITTDTKIAEQIAAAVDELRALELTVGIHGSEGPHDEAEGMTVAQLAAIHEFGIGVPERSFLRSGIRAQRKKITRNLELAGKRVVELKLEPKQALGLVGEDLVGEIKARIANKEITQDLADATVEAKERTNVRSGHGTGALIDTGQLINSITHKVG